MLITAAQTIKALIDDSISPDRSIPHSVHESVLPFLRGDLFVDIRRVENKSLELQFPDATDFRSDLKREIPIRFI